MGLIISALNRIFSADDRIFSDQDRIISELIVYFEGSYIDTIWVHVVRIAFSLRVSLSILTYL